MVKYACYCNFSSYNIEKVNECRELGEPPITVKKGTPISANEGRIQGIVSGQTRIVREETPRGPVHIREYWVTFPNNPDRPGEWMAHL